MKIDFSIGDAKHIDAPNNSYDAAIFSFNGLMMIPGRRNRLQAMKEIERVLKDKGYFIFTTHDRGNEKEEKRIKYRKEEKIRRNT
jgi:ubiquinone/menaquinone biosynthesis C-methylase UbiE